MPARILCVGRELDFVSIRCEVLAREGYEAKAVVIWEAETALRHEVFDLIILSAQLSDQERSDIYSVVQGRIPVLQLEPMTFPLDLLSKVEEHLRMTTTPSGREL